MSTMTCPLLWKIGCINAAIAIVVASAGGHKPWDEDRRKVFNTASKYHLFGSVGTIISSFKYASYPGFMFLFGTLLFSGTAYYRCFKDDRSYNKLMPIGGMLFIFGWIVLAFN